MGNAVIHPHSHFSARTSRADGQRLEYMYGFLNQPQCYSTSPKTRPEAILLLAVQCQCFADPSSSSSHAFAGSQQIMQINPKSISVHPPNDPTRLPGIRGADPSKSKLPSAMLHRESHVIKNHRRVLNPHLNFPTGAEDPAKSEEL